MSCTDPSSTAVVTKDEVASDFSPSAESDARAPHPPTTSHSNSTPSKPALLSRDSNQAQFTEDTHPQRPLAPLGRFENGDIIVDPSTAVASGARSAVSEGESQGDAKVQPIAKGKGGKMGKRGREEDGGEPKPLKKPRPIVRPSSALVQPPPLDRFQLGRDKLDQLAAQFGTPFSSTLASVGVTFPSKQALYAVLDFSQRIRGHKLRCFSSYCRTSNSTQLLGFGCAFARGSGSKHGRPYVDCPVRVKCQPAPELGPDGSPTGDVQGPEGEWQVIEVTSWEHNHAVVEELAELEGREWSPSKAVKGQTAALRWPGQPVEEDNPGVAQQKTTGGEEPKGKGRKKAAGGVEGKDRSATPVAAGPGHGRGKTIPTNLPPPGPVDDDESDADDLLAQLEQVIREENAYPLAPAETLGPNRAPSPLSSASSSAGSSQSSEYDFNKPENSIHQHPFDQFASTSRTRPPLTFERLRKLAQPQGPQAGSSDGSPGASFDFDLPGVELAEASNVTSPNSDEESAGLVQRPLEGHGETVHASLQACVSTPRARRTPAAAQPLVLPRLARLASPSPSPSPAAVRVPGVGPKQKLDVDQDDLCLLLADLEPSLVSCAEKLGEPDGLQWNSFGRVKAFLNALKPNEIEALVAPSFIGAEGCGTFRAKLLGRAVAVKREAGLVWRGLERGWVAKE